jgi:hypothetical protein
VESAHELGKIAAAMVLGSSTSVSTAENRGGEMEGERVEGVVVALRHPSA